MFDHNNFEVIQFEHVPLNRDIFMMDSKWMTDYERAWEAQFRDEESDPYTVGYVSYVAARTVGDDWIELSWYPNTHDRFHEVPIFLPRSAFVACVEICRYDDKPRLFVQPDWLNDLHERPMAAFAIVDAVGVKDLLRRGNLQPELLRKLRNQIDAIADRFPDFAFVSFADSLLIKQAWSVGQVNSTTKYTYAPELLLPVIAELHIAFHDALGVPAYCIMTQGVNAYDDDVCLHKSQGGNHVSLNTLGVPFAQLMAIEAAARNAIKMGAHASSELYLDSTVFRSLKMAYGFDKQLLHAHTYQSPITKSQTATYVATSLKLIRDNLGAGVLQSS